MLGQRWFDIIIWYYIAAPSFILLLLIAVYPHSRYYFENPSLQDCCDTYRNSPPSSLNFLSRFYNKCGIPLGFTVVNWNCKTPQWMFKELRIEC